MTDSETPRPRSETRKELTARALREQDAMVQAYDDAPPPRPRMNAATVMDKMSGLLEAAVTRAPAEPYVSVEFTRNAKGETQINTKVTAPGGADLDALELLAKDALQVAQNAYESACAAYPTGSGFVRNEGQ